MSCLLVLLLSLDKFLLHYLKKRWLSPRISTSPSKSRRSMAAAAAGGGGAKWSETAMLVIDMQKDFVDPAMRSPMLVDGGQAVVPTVAEAVAVARERGIYVVWVVREHDPSGADVEIFRRRYYSGGKGPTVKGVQTPNCIRQTVFDAVALDYEKVTVIIDATAAARPEIHLCE
uniref:Isochorismatase-like domain-containing protein n=1 Tax=Oryza barthii TaxID=65489 RepID=A0A0D3F3K7_9ORYZ